MTRSLCLSPSVEHVDHLVVGTVIQEVKTSNVAREVCTVVAREVCTVVAREVCTVVAREVCTVEPRISNPHLSNRSDYPNHNLMRFIGFLMCIK